MSDSLLTNIHGNESQGIKFAKLQRWIKQACVNAGISTGSSDSMLSDIQGNESEGTMWAILQRWQALLANNISGGGGGGGSGITALTGDLTASGTGSVAATLATTGVSAGTYGSASLIPVVTVDAKGRVTTISTSAVSGGGGTDPNPFASWSPTNSNVIFIGDSLSSVGEQGPFVAPQNTRWTVVLSTLSALAGKANFITAAMGGATVGTWLGSYATTIHPYRPTGSITKSAAFVWLGTNDAWNGSTDGFKSGYATLLSQLRADGFSPIIALTAKGQGLTTNPLHKQQQEEIVAAQYQSKLWDYLAPIHSVFNDDYDTVYISDGTHLTPYGDDYLARWINNWLLHGAPLDVQVNRGANRGVDNNAIYSLVSNNWLTTQPRAFTASQAYTPVTLTDASAIAWDGTSQPWAKISLATNRGLGPMQNPLQGVLYHLEVKRAVANTAITFDAIYAGPGTTATQSTAENSVDVFEGFYDGTNVNLFLKGSYTIASAVSNTVLISDFFNNNTYDYYQLTGVAPDQVNLPGNTWSGYSSNPFRYRTATHVAEANGGAANYYDVGVADGTLHAIVTKPNGGTGGIMVRVASLNGFESGITLIADGTNSQWILCEYYKNGSGISTFNNLASGAMTLDTTSGNVLKINATGSTIKAYVDGVLKATQTDTYNAGSTKIGILNTTNNITRVDNLTFSTP